MIPYTLLRVGFYFYHLNTYRLFSQEEIFESFLLGIRFDVAAICLVNAPIVLLSSIQSFNERYLRIERILFIFINASFIIGAANDYELFSFMGKRLSWDFFVITQDIFQQLPQVFLHFWYLPMGAVAFAVWSYFLDRKYFALKLRRISSWKLFVSSVLVIGFSFVGIRGGLQHKSINVQSAFIQGKNDLGHLVLNSPYHFLRTLRNQSSEKKVFFASDDEAKNIILNSRNFKRDYSEAKKSNVILIILESFSLEYVEEGFAPFLSELKTKSLSFPYHLANGRRSIEALPSFLCALPSLLDEPISKSNFQSNQFDCFPDHLKKNGYTNLFYHAGARGTMGFESYTLSHGIDKYFSKENYPDQKDFDGTWGIFDEPYLKYVGKELGKYPTPFFVGIFTLSSHQPYAIPFQYKGKFPKGTLEIHESIGYTDYSLREFFTSIKNEPWYKDTLFIITADHTQKLHSKKFQTMVGRYRVPFIIFHPSKDLSGINTEKVTQHSDIPESVLDFVGVKGDLNGMGASVFSEDIGMAVDYVDGTNFVLVKKDGVVSLDKNGDQSFYSHNWENGELVLAGKSENPLLKAYLQYYINGLIKNNLSLYR
jgi:phosphoglycerol transferase MdoB-like AlkP superfamily enzyme